MASIHERDGGERRVEVAGRGWLKGHASKSARKIHVTQQTLYERVRENKVEKDVVTDNGDKKKRRKSGRW